MLYKNNHEIDWKNAKIVDREQDYYKKCCLESWHIMTQKELMNWDLGTLPHCIILSYLGRMYLVALCFL